MKTPNNEPGGFVSGSFAAASVGSFIPASTTDAQRDPRVVSAKSSRSLSGLGRRKREAAPARTVFAGLQAHSSTMGQKTGVLEERRSQIWTAEAASQPTIPKSDRLLDTAVARGQFAGVVA